MIMPGDRPWQHNGQTKLSGGIAKSGVWLSCPGWATAFVFCPIQEADRPTPDGVAYQVAREKMYILRLELRLPDTGGIDGKSF